MSQVGCKRPAPDDDDDDDEDDSMPCGSAPQKQRNRGRGDIHQRCAVVIDAQVGTKWDKVEQYLTEKHQGSIPLWTTDNSERRVIANSA